MKPTLEIFSQGEEIVTGQIADTNAAWLSQQAVELGFLVTRHTAVGDKLDDLVALLKEIAQRADCCLCTGGLGPTTDDLTAEAVAMAFDLPLVFDETAYAQIQAFFDRRNRTMPASNRKQALLPSGAVRLDNDLGTAPGFAVQAGRCWFAFMPGVPSEMRHLFTDRILPSLPSRFPLQADRLITLKTIGLGESSIQELIAPITIPESVSIGYRASVGEVQVKLLFPYGYPDAEASQLTNLISTTLDAAVFAIDDSNKANSSDIISVIDGLMRQQQLTLAVQETASHGLLSSHCLGADWLLSSGYQHAFSCPQDFGDPLTYAQQQAKSLQNSGADCALIQIIDQPQAQLADKNQTVNLSVYLQTPDANHFASYPLSGPITRKQQQAALLSLDLLRRYLQKCIKPS
ncbi:CinA family nicotinamide mononucleotide deamidase-related protein [Methylosoma difficile]